MRRELAICSLLLAPLAFGAQHSKPAVNPGSAHSNAPAATPAVSSDRDKGTDRAADVGKGKQKGLKKHQSKQKKGKS